MKKLQVGLWVLFTLLLTGMSSFVLAQSNGKVCTPPPPLGDTDKLIGNWTGTYTFEGNTYDLNVNFKKETGKLVATLGLSNFDVKPTAFKTWICPSNEIHFSYTLPNSHLVEFNGRPNGNEFTGDFRYKEHPKLCVAATDTFTLRKKRTLVSGVE